MSGIFSPPKTPTLPPIPQAPSMSDAAVQEATAGLSRARQGRASTFLTDPGTQREAETSKQRTLLVGA